MSESRPEILPLTGLRFVAALYVFIFHIQIRWPLFPDHPFLSRFLSQGATGMSLFFMLSGFVLAHRYSGEAFSQTSYFLSRIARVYPIYVLSAILALPWLGLSLHNASHFPVLRATAQILVLVAMNLLLVQAWFPQFFEYWNGNGSWSISVEAFFYLLFPFLLKPLKRLSAKGLLAVAALSYAAGVIPGISLVIFDHRPGNIFYSMPIFRLPEFVLGVICSLALPNLSITPKQATLAQTLVLVILVIYLGTVGERMPLYVGHNGVVLPAIAILLVTFTKASSPIATFLSSRPLLWAGKISYCFYSFQVILVLFLGSHFEKLAGQIPLLRNPQLLLLSTGTLLFLLSSLGHYAVEEPLRKWLNASFAKSTIPPRSTAFHKKSYTTFVSN